MRLLVACPACHRQYDASGRPIGAKFRCRCGEVVTISCPEGHDAAVIRCASCGAPRSGEAQKCTFCGADFTLRDQDLETVCPHCFARVSDRAKFCDHCGVALTPESLDTIDTPLICPDCPNESRLKSRTVDGFAMLECPVCAGLWLGNEVFQHLIERAKKEGAGVDGHPANRIVRRETVTEPERSHHLYPPCPVCRQPMVRRQYAHSSGVILEVCSAHGIWLNADKLPRVLDWVRSGGQINPELGDAERGAEIEKLAELREARSQAQAHSDLGTLKWIGELLAFLFR